MKKPILATNLDGFLIKHEAFSEPHKLWFRRAISLTKNKSLEKWIGRKDYFKGVDEAMREIMPKATNKKRTEQARRWYQEDVLSYIQTHPEVCYKNVSKELKKLKEKYTLALITSGAEEYIIKILEAIELKGLYDLVFSTKVSEKPNKKEVIKKFIKKYGKPLIYLSGKEDETLEEISKKGIRTIYANWKKIDSNQFSNLFQ